MVQATSAAFLLAVLRNDRLTPDLARQRVSMQVETAARHTNSRTGVTVRSGFGLGWSLILLGDRPVLMHTGNDQGCFAIAIVSPATDSAVVVLTNSTHGHEAVLPILDELGFDPAFVAHLRDSAR